MKIAIIGTRGIPNRYGGFEQFAEMVSKQWIEDGHEVICYNPKDHEYQENIYQGVEIRHIYCPENRIGAAANFIYDYLCLRDAVRSKCDIYLELGYQSSAFSFYLINKKERKKLVTNMDGMEWMRSKWSSTTKRITKFAEKCAVKLSACLVSDNDGIADYYKSEYGRASSVIAYGCDADIVINKALIGDVIEDAMNFDLVIARLEPENNVEMIIDGFLNSRVDRTLIIVGGLMTKHAQYLTNKFRSYERVKFVGAIYKKPTLDALRHYCSLYYHGHSVGGTNPSLLEAMAVKARIVAHNNQFNKAVLSDNAFYFEDVESVAKISKSFEQQENALNEFKDKNYELIKVEYTWKKIADKYIKLFNKVAES